MDRRGPGLARSRTRVVGVHHYGGGPVDAVAGGRDRDGHGRRDDAGEAGEAGEDQDQPDADPALKTHFTACTRRPSPTAPCSSSSGGPWPRYPAVSPTPGVAVDGANSLPGPPPK
jgi:hypothetical protein